jgi:hypothetical protein
MLGVVPGIRIWHHCIYHKISLAGPGPFEKGLFWGKEIGQIVLLRHGAIFNRAV